MNKQFLSKTLSIVLVISFALSNSLMLMPLIAKARVLCENVIVVSNTDDDVFDVGENLLGKAVLTWDQNSAWIASTSIDGANWIWKSYLVENPSQDETYIFKRSFDIIGVPASATLKVATDNSYKAWVNDVFIGEDTTEKNYTSAGQDQHDITNLHTGSNNIKFEVKNWAGDSNPENNPAGLLYKLEIVRSSCEPQCVPQSSTETNCTDGLDDDCDGAIDGQDSDCQITINASKIICDDEADLPNWGTGSGIDYPDTVIGPGTAIAYVGEHPNCHLVPGWSFQWGQQESGDPGRDFYGEADNGYTTFGPTDVNGVTTATVTSVTGSYLELREVLQQGYIPFTYDQSHQSNDNNVSAEFYCHDDVLNYDNWDYIHSPNLGTTYYCVGFNTPIRYSCNQDYQCVVNSEGQYTTDNCDGACQAPPTPLGYIAGYKYNDLNKNGSHDVGEPGLGGWNIFVDIDGSGQKDIGDIQYTTNENGYYGLPNVPVGTYNVCEITDGHTGWTNSGPICQNVVVTQDNTTPVDFFNYESPTGSITACKYYDTNKDGEYDSGTDTPLVWNITLWYYLDPQGPGEIIHSTTTDPVSGCVTFNDLSYGTYTVHEDQIGGWVQTAPSPDGSPQIVISDTNDHEVTFLNYQISPTGSIAGYKLEDNDRDGHFDDEEELPDWIIYLDLNHNEQFDQEEPSRTTDGGGFYRFENITLGEYQICEVMQSGWASDYPLCQTININRGEETRVDFFNYESPTTGSLTICKYEDKGVIGQYESGTDTPLAWEMRVDAFEGGTWYTGTNGETGCVTLNGLPFNSYTVSESTETGFRQTYPLDPNTYSVQVSATSSPSVYFLNFLESQTQKYVCDTSTWTCSVSETGQYDTRASCEAACQTPTTTTTVPSAGPTGSYVPVVAGAATEQGQVAGASTTCGPYLLKFIKLGASNDPEEVKKLQSFLNGYLGLALPVSGIYDEITYNAVKQFQLLLKNEVLAPWVAINCLPSENIATGYVYRTTKWAINNMFCPILKPDVSDEKCEGGIIIGFGGEEGTVLGESTTTPTTTTETTPPEETTPLETTEETGLTGTSENGVVKPSQNWLWILLGVILIGGVAYLVYPRKK